MASSGDKVATWAEVQAFITAADGRCIVYVDDSVVSPALVPAATGITDCFGRVELRAANVDSLNVTVLQIKGGATLRNLYAVAAMELQCDSTSATPELDWTIGPSGGYLYLYEGAVLTNTTTSTTAPISVAATVTLHIAMNNAAITVAVAGGQPIINLIPGATLLVEAFDHSRLDNDFVTGGSLVQGVVVDIIFDNATAKRFANSGATPSFSSIVGTIIFQNVDNIAFIQNFTASAVNVFAAYKGLGNAWLTVSGYGGGGGGGGGAGGDGGPPNIPGPGGGAGGGSLHQSHTILVNLNDQIDVVVGAGGASGAGGAIGASGSAGGDGGTTYLIDQTTVPPTVLAAFSGASGGSGAINLLGSHVAGLGGASFLGIPSFPQRLSTNTGFVAAGGAGSLTNVSASPGTRNVDAIGTTAAAPLWSPGTFGGSAVNAGGGGGGGGAGVGGNGATGATGIVSNGTAGSSAAANSGAGGGGGAGGNSGGTGGAGGAGGSGALTVAFWP